jgi:single-strand DNA-binding protein
MYLNKVLLIGNLTRDPELKSLPSGIQVATFGLATNRVYRDRDGNKQEQPEFHNITVFARQAETSAQYLRKGDSAMIEGRIQTRSWEKDGQKQYRTEIVAESVQFGAKRGEGGGGGYSSAGGASANTSAAPKKTAPAKQDEGVAYPQEDINPDDIPF